VWKWLLGIAAVLLLGCVGSGVYLKTSGRLDELMLRFRPELKPKSVRLATVARGDLVRTVSAPGQVEPRTDVAISAQVSARIIALPFRENDAVKEGDVVVRLDARDLQALVESARAQLKSEEARLVGARAAFANAGSEFRRRQELFSTKDVAQSELDTSELDLSRAESSLRQAEHSIEIARANITRAEKDLDNTVITSPFDGVITALNAEVGETVVVGTLNNPGSVILEIADLSVMLLKARVDETNIAPVRDGQKARVYVNAYPDTRLVGTVDHVGLKRQLDKDGSAYFETEILLELPDGLLLRSGLTANADIEVETFRDVIEVPSQAVCDRPIEDLPAAVTQGNAQIDATKKFARVVFTVEGGKARAVPVKVGASDLTDTVVLAGLEPGVVIVTGPYKVLTTLKHNQVVAEEGAEKPAPGAPASVAKAAPAPAGGT